jgi:nucleoside-diphosphate-sugar epimerase
MNKTVLITGGSGFLGRALCLYFQRKGYVVRALVRTIPEEASLPPGVTFWKGDLLGQIDPQAFQCVDILIHCAYATRVVSQETAYRANHLGTLKMYAFRDRFQIDQFVFISSIAAHEAAESYYGRSKLALEQCMNPLRDLVIRPGLVIGPGNQGTFARMKNSMRKLPVVPIFDGGRQILQTVYLDDLCEAIGLAVEKRLTGALVVAETTGIPMRVFLRRVAERINRPCLLVPLPMQLSLFALKIIEAFRLPFPLSTENLLGLKQMKQMPSEADLKRIGIQLKSAEQSLAACPVEE